MIQHFHLYSRETVTRLDNETYTRMLPEAWSVVLERLGTTWISSAEKWKKVHYLLDNGIIYNH